MPAQLYSAPEHDHGFDQHLDATMPYNRATELALLEWVWSSARIWTSRCH